MIEFYLSDGFKSFIVDLDKMVAEQERALLTLDLSVVDDRALTIAKARAEGAKKISFLIKEKARKAKLSDE